MERINSRGGIYYTPHRNRLAPEIVKKMIFLYGCYVREDGGLTTRQCLAKERSSKFILHQSIRQLPYQARGSDRGFHGVPQWPWRLGLLFQWWKSRRRRWCRRWWWNFRYLVLLSMKILKFYSFYLSNPILNFSSRLLSIYLSKYIFKFSYYLLSIYLIFRNFTSLILSSIYLNLFWNRDIWYPECVKFQLF